MLEQELLWDCRAGPPSTHPAGTGPQEQHPSCSPAHSPSGEACAALTSLPALGHRHTPPKGSALQIGTFLGQHSPGTPPHFILGPPGLDWDQLGRSNPKGKGQRDSGSPDPQVKASVQEPRVRRGRSHTASDLDVLPCPWLPVPTAQEKPGCPAHLPHYPGQTWMSCLPAPQPRTNLDVLPAAQDSHHKPAQHRRCIQAVGPGAPGWILHRTCCPCRQSLHPLTPPQKKSHSQAVPQSHSRAKGEQRPLFTAPSLQEQQFPAQGSQLQLRNRHGEGMSNPNPQGCQKVVSNMVSP